LNQELVTIILLVVFLVCAIGVVSIGIWLYRRGPASKIQGRITKFVETPQTGDEVPATIHERMLLSNEEFGKFRSWINEALKGLSSEKLQMKISSAYWSISDTEFILIRITATVLGFILGWVIPQNILGGIFLAAIAFWVPPLMLERAITRRQELFHDQLLDVLILIKGAVQAGYSLMQALDMTAKEIKSPSSEEFGRVLREVRFGIPLEQALLSLAERMENDDLHIVVTAIIINTQVGGNLSTVLEATISTIRDRMHLFGEVRSLTAYARYVGNFLTLMPFLTGLAIFFISPGYFETVKTSLFTQIVIVIAIIGVILGNIWIRNVVKIKV